MLSVYWGDRAQQWRHLFTVVVMALSNFQMRYSVLNETEAVEKCHIEVINTEELSGDFVVFFDDKGYNGIANAFFLNVASCLAVVLVFLLVWNPGTRQIRIISALDQRVQRRQMKCLADRPPKSGEKVEFLRQAPDLQAGGRNNDLAELLLSGTSSVRSGSDAWGKIRITRWLFLDDVLAINPNLREESIEYLVFQRYIILIEFIMCLQNFATVLPVNKRFGSNFKDSSFEATTMENLESGSNYLWVHLASSIFIYLMIITVIYSFTRRIRKSLKRQYLESREPGSRTLLLTGLPNRLKNKRALKAHLNQMYPGVEIRHINVNIGFPLQNGLRTAELEYRNLRAIVRLYSSYDCDPPKVHEAGQCCWCIFLYGFNYCLCYDLRIDGLKYYERKLEEHVDLMKEKKRYLLSRKETLDTAFVEFKSVEMAQHLLVMAKYRFSSFSYTVEVAPKLEAVRWSRLASTNTKFLKGFIIDVISVFIVCLGISFGDLANQIQKLIQGPEASNNFLTNLFENYQFSRTIWTYAWTYIYLYFMFYLWRAYYWTETSYNNGILMRTYILLMVCLYFVPVLNLTTFQKKSEALTDFSFRCMFLSDNGVYFIISLMSYGLFGNMVELLRIPNVLRQLLVILGSASIPEMKVRSRAVSHDGVEFIFGEHLAYFLAFFTINCVISSLSPLILPWGLLYSINKHMVDSYNLIVGLYRASQIDQRQFFISATNTLVFAGILTQINTMLYVSSRDGSTSAVSRIGSFIVSVVTILTLIQVETRHRWPIPLFATDRQVDRFGDDTDVKKNIYQPPIMRYGQLELFKNDT